MTSKTGKQRHLKPISPPSTLVLFKGAAGEEARGAEEVVAEEAAEEAAKEATEGAPQEGERVAEAVGVNVSPVFFTCKVNAGVTPVVSNTCQSTIS